MTKLGIDIVDLSDPQIQKRNQRTLKLVLNPEDQTIEHPLLFWILWSAKEAVFKCYREALNFSPTQISIKLAEIDGEISFTSKEFSGKIIISNSNILAICSDDLNAIEYEILETEKIGTGSMVKEHIATYFKEKDLDVVIGSDDLNLPVIEPGSVPISISHHHHWSAFAYPKTLRR